MIKTFVVDKDRLRQFDGLGPDPEQVVWADLMEPTREEEAAIEAWLGIGIPTREEMDEIEISSRLYAENGAYFMTATLPAHADGDNPVIAPVTFVLVGKRLITVRYHEPRAFRTFPMRAEKVDTQCTSGQTILIALLEAIVDRLADLIERTSREIVEISHDIFHPKERTASKRDRNFQIILRRIGRKEDLISNIQDSLLTLQRLSGFLGHITLQAKDDRDIRDRVKTLSRDVASLTVHASFVTQKITFLLDATLGMIGIEQNSIIKIVSVAAVVFLPPTLVASIYGMNFVHMPELAWQFGYPMVLGIMVVSAVLPYWFFKRRGWL